MFLSGGDGFQSTHVVADRPASARNTSTASTFVPAGIDRVGDVELVAPDTCPRRSVESADAAVEPDVRAIVDAVEVQRDVRARGGRQRA